MQSKVETTDTRISIYIEGFVNEKDAETLAMRIYRHNKPAGIYNPRFMYALWRRERKLSNGTVLMTQAYNLVVDNHII